LRRREHPLLLECHTEAANSYDVCTAQRQCSCRFSHRCACCHDVVDDQAPAPGQSGSVTLTHGESPGQIAVALTGHQAHLVTNAPGVPQARNDLHLGVPGRCPDGAGTCRSPGELVRQVRTPPAHG
jgi:hypothetical protein